MTATTTAPQQLGTEDPIHLKYRPKVLEQVIGHRNEVASLQKLVDRKDRPHTYIFTGPSGVGKTTLARLLAHKFGAVDLGIQELDAGTVGAVENIRALVEQVGFAPLVGKAKAIILDECHVFSRAAWNALLKSTEEPPSHVYYFFLTTELSKIPEAMKTRGISYQLKSVAQKDLFAYGKLITELEGLALPDEAVDLIASCANGSPRALLVHLSKCRNVTDLDTIKKLLASVGGDDTDPIIQIARMIINKQGDAAALYKFARDMENYGGARAILKSYCGKVFANKPGDWVYNSAVLTELDKMPMFPAEQDGLSDLLLFLGRYLKLVNGK